MGVLYNISSGLAYCSAPYPEVGRELSLSLAVFGVRAVSEVYDWLRVLLASFDCVVCEFCGLRDVSS